MKRIDVDYGYRLVDDDGNIIAYNGGGTDQGWVYKDYGAWKSGAGICYISEYALMAYEEETKHLSRDELVEFLKGNTSLGYTRQDLIDLCGGDENLAESLFYELDWQYPETLLAEQNY